MTNANDTFNGIPLYAGEKAEPLDDSHYIIQSDTAYRFGTDAVKLAEFAAQWVKREHSVFDLCSGCGIVGVLLALERGCRVDGAELDQTLWSMSARSCAINRLDNVRFYNGDIREIKYMSFAPSAYDCVVCNPPFYKADSKPSAIAPSANSELTVTLADVIVAAKYLLKVGGALCLVHTSSRLDEALCVCKNNGLTPKTLNINGNGKTFLLRAVRGGRAGMTVKTC